MLSKPISLQNGLSDEGPTELVVNSSSQLCSECANLALRPSFLKQKKDHPHMDHEIVPLKYKHTDTLPELKGFLQSAQRGCQFCAFLRRAVLQRDKYKRFKSDNRVKFFNARYVCKTEFGGEGFCELQIETEGPWMGDLCIRLMSEPSVNADTFGILSRPIDPDALSPSNVKVMKGWIDKCVQQCGAHCTEEKFVPTRLLHVGSNEDNIEPHLVITKDDLYFTSIQHSDCRYAALSYRWGLSGCDLKTEISNLAQRMDGISPEIMPQTFQDAIKVTRGLGLSYLWIDALCIIQDDRADWQKESAAMSEVFRHAFVTIAAVKSDSCTKSFLERNPRLILRVPISSSTSNKIYIPTRLTRVFQHISSSWLPSFRGSARVSPGEGNTISSTTVTKDSTPNNSYMLVSCPDAIDFIPGNGIESDPEFQAWQSRGWIFQEHHLSQRILYFGTHMIYYACGYETRSEDGVSLDWGYFGRKWADHFTSPSANVYTPWYATIEKYSTTHVTRRSDRLPAISGLAKYIAQHKNDHYYAGLWSGDLVVGLLWIVSCPRSHYEEYWKELTANYLAPSWSWAAAWNEVAWVFSGDNSELIVMCECEIIDVQTLVKGVNPFGRVDGGYMIMRARSKVIDALHACEGIGPYHFWEIKSAGQVVGKATLDWSESGPSDAYGPKKGFVFKKPLVGILLAHFSPGSNGELISYAYMFYGKKRVLAGILLLADENPDEYRRVGSFYIFDSEGNGDYFASSPFEKVRII